VAFDRLLFRIHAIERMLEHEITEIDVRDVLERGEVIEEVRDEHSQMKRLYLHHVDSRPIHVVAIDNDQMQCTVVITAYEPDLMRWEQGSRKRRR